MAERCRSPNATRVRWEMGLLSFHTARLTLGGVFRVRTHRRSQIGVDAAIFKAEAPSEGGLHRVLANAAKPCRLTERERAQSRGEFSVAGRRASWAESPLSHASSRSDHHVGGLEPPTEGSKTLTAETTNEWQDNSLHCGDDTLAAREDPSTDSPPTGTQTCMASVEQSPPYIGL